MPQEIGALDIADRFERPIGAMVGMDIADCGVVSRRFLPSGWLGAGLFIDTH